ncbi:hypothetical protein BSLG_006445 [Batrachochytrium salamandrivorans]|nr:hypothetical protein BASA81_016057 [Batrachochytrium salamandrivorans]KAJ1338808.1 hypothetical protein BSLG_006445 [Batrachochytrium salamandrivorans]
MSTPASSNEKQQDSLEYNPDEAPHLVTLQKLTCAEYNQNADNLDNFDSLGIDEKLSKSDVNIRDIKQLEDVDTIDQECSLDHPLAAKSGSTQETPLNSSFDLQQVGSSDSNGIMSNAYADDPGYSQAEEEKAPGFEMEDNTAHFSHEFDSVNFMETSNPTAEPLALDNSHTTSRATSCIQSQAISTSTLALCKSLSRHDQSGDSRANITQGGQSIVRQRSSRSDDSTNIQFGEKLNRPWSYHTYAHHSDIPASIFEFHTIFSQPHKIRPMALATGSVWFRVSPAPDMVHWTVAYRFEHSHTIYSFMIPVLNSCSSFTNSEFCSMLERLSKLNVSPLHKINSIIASKKQQASDPLTQKLFFTKGEDEYGKGGSRSDIVPDTSFYQATYEDAQKVMGRASLDAATMAHIPASTKSWSTTHALGEMEKQHLIEKLTTFQKARVEKGLLL